LNKISSGSRPENRD